MCDNTFTEYMIILNSTVENVKASKERLAMKNDEWRLTQELRRLRKYGFCLQARRCSDNQHDYRYDIVFANSNEILEPYCSLEEVLGIINSVETCLEMITKYGKSRETEVGTEERKFDCAGVIIGQQKE